MSQATTAPRRILRVNADDLGFTPGVTDGILKAHQEGIVTHASIMPNGLDFDRAAALCLERPALKVGVHLVLTWGRPVLSPEAVPSLVGPEGTFHPLKVFLRRLLTGRINRAEVGREWRAQVEKVIQAGIRPGHLDSHHHVHVFPGCFRAAVGIVADCGLDWLRRPVERIRGGAYSTPSAKSLLLAGLCRRRWPCRSADHFAGLAVHDLADFGPALDRLIEGLPPGLTELMVHPGEPDDDVRREDIFVDQRRTQLQALIDPARFSVLKRADVTLDRAAR